MTTKLLVLTIGLAAAVASAEQPGTIDRRPSQERPLQNRNAEWKAVLASRSAIAGSPRSADATASLAYSSYFGTSRGDEVDDLKLDAAGNLYVLSSTESLSFPNTRQAGTLGKFDVVVTKFDPAGKTILYSTILGGSQNDWAAAIAIDPQGNAYVTGYTESANFPTQSAYQPTFHGTRDAFVTKLNATGEIQYSTFLGGSQPQPCGCTSRSRGYGIAVDRSGRAWVTGLTFARDFPVTVSSLAPDYGEAFVTALDASGSSMAFSMMLGGRLSYDAGYNIKLDASGNAYVVGDSDSTDFPVTANAYQKINRRGAGWGDAFIAKITAGTDTTSSILASTFFGGAGADTPWGLALDLAGNVYIAGVSQSANLPVTSGALQPNYGGGDDYGDGYVAKLDGSLSTLTYSTYVGGSGDDGAQAIFVDNAGSAYVVGWTESPNLQTTPGAVSAYKGLTDSFLLKLNTTGTKADVLSYIGGSSHDLAFAVGVTSAGEVVIAGYTNSANYPTVSSASYQATHQGLYDGFLTRISFGPKAGGVTLTSIVNAASYTSGKVSAGEIVLVYGSDMGPGTLTTYTPSADGSVPKQLAGVRVLFDQVEAPVVYASARQSAVVVPYAVTGKSSTRVVVEYNGVASPPVTVQVVPAVPSLFSSDGSGKGAGAILNQNGTLNTATNPAAPGSVVILYGTGEGQTLPAGADGKPGPGVLDQLPRPVLPATVTIGGLPAQVLYAGGVPGVVAGEFQINAIVPAGVAPGDREVIVRFGEYASQPGLTVRVQ